MTADEAATAALQALVAALEDLHAPAMIIGGIGVIARGVPRTTLDIDATVWGEGLDIQQTVGVFARHGIAPRVDDAVAFAREHQVLLLRHEASGTPIDLTIAWLPFEQQALARATRVDLGSVSAPVALPEDLIVYKAVAWRDRDRTDIERLVRLHHREIDVQRVRGLVAQFAAALDAPERIAEFEATLARATRGR
jgi:hypothetical protein